MAPGLDEFDVLLEVVLSLVRVMYHKRAGLLNSVTLNSVIEIMAISFSWTKYICHSRV